MRATRLAAVVVGAVAAVSALTALLALPADAQTPDQGQGRTITVNGTGSVTAVPDRAEWSFGVQTEAATASEALRRNGTAMNTLLDALKAAGIPASDLKTEQVSIFPRTSPEGTEIVGYTASNSVRAVVKDIAKAGAIVDAATEAGANNVYGPTLTVSDAEAIYDQALDKAFAKAKAKAERIAATAGASLGQVVSIQESGIQGPVPLPATGGADQAASTPVQPGTTEIQGTLTVTFQLA